MDKGLKERLEHVAASDFARVTYTEAVEILKVLGVELAGDRQVGLLAKKVLTPVHAAIGQAGRGAPAGPRPSGT